jgi:creatinine amidohydrolase/Fe(II)-dependent formamide hydrolase-like protein
MLVEHMTWEDYRDEVGRRIIILPAGALEQPGPPRIYYSKSFLIS